MFSLQLSLVSVADNSHFCLFHINPYAKHKKQNCPAVFFNARETKAQNADCDSKVTPSPVDRLEIS